MKRSNVWRSLLFLVGLVLGVGAPGYAQDLMRNGGFEHLDAKRMVIDWSADSWNTNSEMGITDLKSHSGKYAGIIQSGHENDARLIQKVVVEPDTVYRLQGWVAVEEISQGQVGANLSVMGGAIRSNEIRGTRDWQRLELVFKTKANQTSVFVGARLGFYGSTTAGTAYFDDLTLEKVLEPQATFQLLDDPSVTFNSNAARAVTIYQPKSLQTTLTNLLGFFNYSFWIVILYLGMLAVLLRRKPWAVSLEPEKRQWLETHLPLIMWGMAAVAFAIRLPLLPEIPFKVDLGNFKAWTLRIAETGPVNFYAPGYYCDYPPFSLYIFWFLGKVIHLFRLEGNEILLNSIIKLPSVLCDLGTAWLILSLARKKNPFLGGVLAGIYLVMPAILYNSAYWGQVDTYYVFMVLGALILLVKKRQPEWAAAIVAASFLTKAQTIAFIPLFLLYLFLNFEWKRWVSSFGAAIAAFVLILLPFNLHQSLTWIVDLYSKQAGLYPYASLNAANFLALLNGNNQLDTVMVLPGITFAMLGYGLFISSVAWSCWYYWRKRTWLGMLTAFTMIAYAFFMFFPRMHERYLFPVFAFFLVLFLYTKDRRLYYINLLLNISNLLNMHAVVLKFQNTLTEEMFQRAIYILALVNTILFIATFTIFHLQLIRERRRSKATWREYDQSLQQTCFNLLKVKPFRLTVRDYQLLAGIVLVYSAIIFFRLGSIATPKTGMDLLSPLSGVEVTFEHPVSIRTAAWYDGEGTGQLRVERFSNGVWQDAGLLSCDGYYVLKRQTMDLSGVERIKLTPQPSVGQIKEVAFLDFQNEPLPIQSVHQFDHKNAVAAKAHPLFDEQAKMVEMPSNQNSTYFDEIYHGRTAYEFVRHSTVYETTHPPLGKDILAMGVALFGMNPFGMRVMHAIVGIILIVALFFLGRQLLASRFGAYATLLFGFFDFMPLVQSRYSTIDSTSVLLITLMLIFTFKYIREQLQPGKRKSSWGTIALVILFYALAASVKWTGHYGFVGVVTCVGFVKLWQYLELRDSLAESAKTVSIKNAKTTKTTKNASQNEVSAETTKLQAFWRENFGWTVLQWIVLFVLIAPVVYYLSYIPFLQCQNISDIFSQEAFQQVIENQKGMYSYHSLLTATHPFSSTWWSWPFDFKPLWIYSSGEAQAGLKGTIVSMGNPIIWTLGWCAVLLLVYQLLIRRKLSLYHLIFICFFALYLPWVLVSRATFIYHFFPVLPLYYVLGVTLLMPLWQMKKNGRQVIYALAVLAIGLWMLYYPALTGLAVPENYLQALRWFPKDWLF